MKLEAIAQLPEPEAVKEAYPISKAAAQARAMELEAIKAILRGDDSRKLLLIGPCSADRADAVLDYLARLRNLQDQVQDKLLFIPRVYANKPRSLGIGYKGMAESPDPAGPPDMTRGLVAMRRLHVQALTDYGFACADELLYPDHHAYLDDLLAYVTVGARSVENQQHRLVASGLDIPVGMKNPTSGDLSVMLNAIYAAQQAQVLDYRGWACQSHGNPYAHAILRGWVNREGVSQPNYHYEDLVALKDRYLAMTLENPALIVDVNHANSGKDFAKQPRIVQEVLHNMEREPDLGRLIKGFMVESYLVDGSQPVDGTCYGQSITDPCLGWEKTEALVYDLAEAL